MKNKTMMQYFEWYLPADCNHWNRLKDDVAHLQEAGITAVWLPPAYKGAYGKEGVGYTAYDLYDLGEFDQKGSIPTKYGTKDEYLAAVKACKQHDIAVYPDIVLNHKIGADAKETVVAKECAPDNREKIITGDETIEAWTIFDFKGRGGKYSDFTWNASHFDGIDWNDSKKKNAIYLINGKSWDEQVDTQYGNYDYLMGADIDFENEEVINELTRWGEWYIDMLKMDGFRLDAIKHIGAQFYKEWLPKMREYAKKDMFAVGEYWSGDVNVLKNYLSEVEYDMSLFDVPLHWNFHWMSKEADKHDLRQIFNGTLVETNSEHAVTFVDNHDTQPGQALESFVDNWFKLHAYALILLRNTGYPCVFYGDYYGIPHDNIAGFKSELDRLLAVRRDKCYGQQHDYFNDYHCIGWTMEGDDEHADSSVAVLMSTGNSYTYEMYMGEKNIGKTYTDILNNAPQTIVNEQGNAQFTVMPGKVSVWVIKE